MFKRECISLKYIPLNTDDMRKIEHTKLLLKIRSLIFRSPYRLFLSKGLQKKILTRPRSAHKLYNSTINSENLMQTLMQKNIPFPYENSVQNVDNVFLVASTC